MFHAVMSNSNSVSEEGSFSSGIKIQDFGSLNQMVTTINSNQNQQKIKKKRNLPGNPDPEAEVIALSPKTLMATNRFVCEVCKKGFQRDQNLQLHRRGHNLPWKLKQRSSKEIRKRVYVCPESSCVHHHPSRALGDLTGIKKHFCRKHGEKKWKCDKCSKIYAVQSDWKAHSKTCGTREYRCDCGTLFSRKDSFITHRAFCDALAEESARLSSNPLPMPTQQNPYPLFPFSTHQQTHVSLYPNWDPTQNPNPNPNPVPIKPETISSLFFQEPPPPPQHMTLKTSPFQNLHVSTQPTSDAATSAAHLSATALLQKASTFGQVTSTMNGLDTRRFGAGMSPDQMGFTSGCLATWQKSDRMTRDFMGLTAECGGGDGGGGGGGGAIGNGNANVNVRELLSYTGGVEFPTYDRDQSLLKPEGFWFC